MKIVIIAFLLILAGTLLYYPNLILPTRNAPARSAGDMVVIYSVQKKGFVTVPVIRKSAADWKKTLTPEQFYITVRKGTEKPFTNKYYKNKEKGIYKCVRCGTDLFSSEQKYDSGSGWPSFWAPVSEDNITFFKTRKLFRIHTQVFCARCDSYLGEVFDDGPPPTHKRYCLDSPALAFVADEEI
jgi:peptide-methionine (R)-S-oxide reductase